MSSRLNFFLFIPLLFLGVSGLKAQEVDYLKHRKTFDLCSFHKQCFGCYTCADSRYEVKIKNNQDKKITAIFYKFYSPAFNTIIEKESKLVGEKIDAHQTGLLYICVHEARHWIISKIVYADKTSTLFNTLDPLKNFLQEPDECDCND
jgi:hypothetical protein